MIGNSSSTFLGRDDAPFNQNIWQKIDDIVIHAAKSQLSVRRLLYVDGPFGLGLKAIPGPDRIVKDESEKGGTVVVASPVQPIPEIQTEFILAARDIAVFDEQGLPLDGGAIAKAAMAAARKEDDILLNGVPELGIKGLINSDGVQTMKLNPWDKVGSAVDTIIQSVSKLDNAGFHGPYTLGLSPNLYNVLFRLYPQGNITEFQHLQTFITDGIVKVPALKAGGVLLASGRQFASIVLGQDLVTSFVGPKGKNFEFVISETVALRLVQSEAVMVLQS